MDLNFQFSEVDVRNLQNLQSIARGGTEAKGIFFDKNGTPFTITMENVKCKWFFNKTQVTISPLDERSAVPSTKLIFNKGKININKISSEIDGLSKEIWDKTPPGDRSNRYQALADEAIKNNKPLVAELHLQKVAKQWNTPAGQKAWQALDDQGQVEWHSKMADLYNQVLQLGTRLNQLVPRTQQRLVNKAKHHTTQAKLAQMDPNKRSQLYQNLAKKALADGKPQNAFFHLEKAAEQWNTPTGQRAWQDLGDQGQMEWHNKMADLYKQAGNTNLGEYHTNQAKLAQMGPIKRVTFYQNQAKKALDNGNSQNAIKHLNLAAQQWQSREGEKAWEELGVANRANWLLNLAQGFVRAGDFDSAAQYLEQANDQWLSNVHDIDQRAWNDLEIRGQVDWYNKLADAYQRIGDKQKAAELREEAGLLITVEEVINENDEPSDK
jgi:hypothetical protein